MKTVHSIALPGTDCNCRNTHLCIRSRKSSSEIFVRAYPNMWTSLGCKNPYPNLNQNPKLMHETNYLSLQD